MINLTTQTVDEKGNLSTYMAQVPKKQKDPNTGKMIDTMVSEEQPITVFKLFKTALLSNKIRYSQFWQIRRYNLFQKIQGKKEVKLNLIEKWILKILVNRVFDVIVYGQVVEILKEKQ